jgi:hypothetical protein
MSYNLCKIGELPVEMEQMPRMDWGAFHDTHFRPHLVIATLDIGADRETMVVLLKRLASALGASGSYAVTRDRTTVYVAFESEVGATRFANVLRATVTTREPEWASKAVARIDDATQRRIAAALKQHRLKNAKKR